MSSFWPLFNINQIFSLLVTFNVAIPSNGHVILVTIKNVLEMNFMFFGWDKQFRNGSITKIFGSHFLYKLYMAGGFVAMAAIPVALAMITLVVLVKGMGKIIPCLCKSRLVARYFEKVTCLNLLFRAILVTFLPLCVTADIGALFSYKTEGMESMNIGLALFISLVLAGSLAFFWFVSESNLDHDPMRRMFGALYEGMNTRDAWQTAGIFFYFMRRVLLVMALRENIFSVKFAGVSFLQLGQVGYLLSAMPYKRFSRNVIEITNELLVLTMMYFIPLFSDATSMQDLAMHFYYGWYFIGVIFALLLANVGFTVFNLTRLFAGGVSSVGDKIDKEMEDEGRLDLENLTGGSNLPSKISATGRLAVDDALSNLDEVKEA